MSSLTELAVGLACLAGAVVAWPRRLRWIAAVLAVAGVVAVAHAVVWLA
jgi:hypothetical protein